MMSFTWSGISNSCALNDLGSNAMPTEVVGNAGSDHPSPTDHNSASLPFVKLLVTASGTEVATKDKTIDRHQGELNADHFDSNNEDLPWIFMWRLIAVWCLLGRNQSEKGSASQLVHLKYAYARSLALRLTIVRITGDESPRSNWRREEYVRKLEEGSGLRYFRPVPVLASCLLKFRLLKFVQWTSDSKTTDLVSSGWNLPGREDCIWQASKQGSHRVL